MNQKSLYLFVPGYFKAQLKGVQSDFTELSDRVELYTGLPVGSPKTPNQALTVFSVLISYYIYTYLHDGLIVTRTISVSMIKRALQNVMKPKPLVLWQTGAGGRGRSACRGEQVQGQEEAEMRPTGLEGLRFRVGQIRGLGFRV